MFIFSFSLAVGKPSHLPFLRNYTSQRVSSADTSGANDEGSGRNRLMPGETRIIARLAGPGVITHVWFTINTTERWHLENLVLRKGAVVTVTNEGDLPTASLPYNIDWEKHTSLPADLGYFHAQYRQATPSPGWTTDWSPPSPSSATLTR